MFFGSGAAAAAAKAFKELASLGRARGLEALNLGRNCRRPGDVSRGGSTLPKARSSSFLWSHCSCSFAGRGPFWVFGVKQSSLRMARTDSQACCDHFCFSALAVLSTFSLPGLWKVQRAAALPPPLLVLPLLVVLLWRS